MSKNDDQTVEQKMEALRQQAAWFESDEFTLGEASDRFKRAAKLAEEIEKDLSELENTVTVLKKSFEES